ncbi:MAG: hypothetical protein AAGB31_15985 [Bdellovibrio sp.]
MTNIEIVSYEKSWDSYNPKTWVMDPGGKHRNIKLAFTDKSGKNKA